MILQCPTCDARFLINDALVPAQGRVVRCGKCKHEWHASPNAVPIDIELASEPSPAFASFEEALDSASPQQAEALAANASVAHNLPVIHAPAFALKPFIWATAALVAIVWFVAPMAFYPQWKHGPLAGLYEAMGWDASDGLVFADVGFAHASDATKTRYTISGNIRNTAPEERRVSEVRVMLKDGQGEVLWSRIYAVDKALKPKESYPFEIANVETSFGERVRTLVLDLGNSFELGKR